MSRSVKNTCGVAVVAMIIASVVFASRRAARLSDEAHADHLHQSSQRQFEKVKAGQDHVLIFSPELIIMLANDPQCVQNAKRLQLFGCDLNLPGYERIQELSNVRHISFDESIHVEAILPVLKNMPSVDSLYFYLVIITDEMRTQLAAIPTLKTVRHGSIEQKDAEALARALPHMVVEMDDQHSDRSIRISDGGTSETN